jgi:adenine phosphoribosyltransferase
MLISSLIRNVPDYPIPGIMFKDITTLLKSGEGFRFTINEFVNRYKEIQIDKIAGIESRGFIFGSALSFELGIGFIPVRKKGKLPAETVGYDYALEYGTDRVEIHLDAIEKGDKVLLIDDLIATGGTANAAIKLIEMVGGKIVEACFVVDLPFLGGSKRIKNAGYEVFSLCEYDSEHE